LSSSARDFERTCSRHCLSTASSSARCRSSMNPAPRRSSPRYETVISLETFGTGTEVTVMAEGTILRDLEQKPFQILAFRTKQGHGMISSRSQSPHEGHAPAGVERGRENDLLEEVERHVARAGEGHEVPARSYQAHRVEIDVLVSSRG